VACVGVVAGGGLPTPASHLQLPSLSVLEAARGAVEALPQSRFVELARALPVTDAAIAVSTAVSAGASPTCTFGCRPGVAIFLQSAHCSLRNLMRGRVAVTWQACVGAHATSLLWYFWTV
jgi:hypothetical protein